MERRGVTSRVRIGLAVVVLHVQDRLAWLWCDEAVEAGLVEIRSVTVCPGGLSKLGCEWRSRQGFSR